jgi:hypothetical protein
MDNWLRHQDLQRLPFQGRFAEVLCRLSLKHIKRISMRMAANKIHVGFAGLSVRALLFFLRKAQLVLAIIDVANAAFIKINQSFHLKNIANFKRILNRYMRWASSLILG